jgi:hypothetical protein
MANLNRPDTIKGYEPPSDYSRKEDCFYNTFTEGQKETYKNTNVEKKQYTIYGNYGQEKCPECGENPVKSCPCAYSDKKCGKGHSWYTDRNGNVKLGNPH